MSILIIGGAGYIGSHTVKYFIEQNEDVIIVDNLLTGHKEAISSDKFNECDIRDKENLDKIFKENNIEAVIHFAANSLVGESMPSLIIYAPVRVLGNKTIVTNGDQTDTIYEGMDRQLTFEQSLRSREFEPDAPNYTPRISGVLHVENGKFSYAMSILKSNNGNPDSCLRYTFAYENAAAGQGRFIHTYKCDGNPLPSFEGEPKPVEIPDDIDDFTNLLWESLNQDNKVSLFVRFIDIETGKYESRIVNKNK